MSRHLNWPDIPYAPWAETCQALHLYSQIVGKYRLARTPWVNHSWHATLYVDAKGLTTGVVADRGIGIELELDLVEHRLVGTNTNGDRYDFPLKAGTVAGFAADLERTIEQLGGTPEFHGSPNEVVEAIPFAKDDRKRPYDRDAVARFHQALVSIDAVLKKFRTGFLGKVSPVHLFWGSFDMAVTRFSGRKAPAQPGGIPNLPDAVTREAYSHEVSSAGFWPGGGGVDQPAFYSYAYPAPPEFSAARVQPDAAFFDDKLGEFVLLYDDVRRADDPESVLLEFLQSTYEAAASQGAWDRSALECSLGEPGKPRSLR
jgi:hypothetical protein